MVERRRRPDISPRWLTLGEAAQYLGHSPSWLTPERLVRLQETGFPIVDASLERIDREAIDDWSDRRSGRQGAPAPLEDLALTTAGGAPSTGAVSDPWVRAAHELRDAKDRN